MLTLFRLFFMTSICTLLYFAHEDYKDFFYWICGVLDSMSTAVSLLIYVILREGKFDVLYYLKLCLAKFVVNIAIFPFLLNETNIIDLLYMHRWYALSIFLAVIN